MDETNPRVFISYSHEDQTHQDRVLELSNKLRDEGIDCILDQYEESPPEGWIKWMDRSIKNSDFVLLICTETYYDRVMNDNEGKGVIWESGLIYQRLYDSAGKNKKFIPIIFNEGKFENIPDPLKSATFYNVDNEGEYDKLYWRLRGVKTVQKPELGKLRELPRKERKTFFVSGLIEPELWDRAKWKNGVAYLSKGDDTEPPLFTVLFDDFEIGIQIFENIIGKIGNEDLDERLRLSIVEGEAPPQEYGYFVLIGENIEGTNKHIDNQGLKDDVDYIVVNQRINRVYTEVDSKNLSNFKKEYERHGCYYIVPAKQITDPEKGTGFQVGLDYKILKRQIEFRDFEEVSDNNDPDSILKSEGILKHKF